MSGEPRSSERFNYDVIGYLRGTLGLGIAAVNTVTALEASGRAVSPVVVEPRRSSAHSRVAARRGRPDSRRLVLFHINPLEIALFSNQWRAAVDVRLPKACVPFWELPLVPRSWEPMLSAMQAILAPTRFVQAACSTVVPRERILYYPQAVFPPSGIEPAREVWGLSRDATVFLVVFDLDSDIERKNPWAAVHAFQRAFPAAADVQLVIKTKPATKLKQFAEQLAELRRITHGDTRIRILEEWLSYEDVLRLYASSDVMVSLHRSEGLGLHLMEAMSLGRVVVATNWSGNTDFMTADNSVPVPYRLTPVAPQHNSYLPEVGRDHQVWAEPDLAFAAETLRQLHADAGRRAALGAAAARTMESRRRQMLNGATFDELEGLLAHEQGHTARFNLALWRSWRELLLLGARQYARAVSHGVGRHLRAYRST